MHGQTDNTLFDDIINMLLLVSARPAFIIILAYIILSETVIVRTVLHENYGHDRIFWADRESRRTESDHSR